MHLAVLPSRRDRSSPRGPATTWAFALFGVAWAAAWGSARLWGVQVAAADQRTPLLLASGVLAALAAATVGFLALRRWAGTPYVVVAMTSATLAGMATLALHGTRWSFDGLYSDAGFRTEAATRFADSAALADYGYRGLRSYYPPALPWIEGRLADLVGVPAWETMKPVTILLSALVPLLAFQLWRRVVPAICAAAVVAATCLVTADLVKPDEWLVLSLVVPWWLEAVRDVHAPGLASRRAWLHGLVLGGLLLCHSYYFLPLGLASAVGLVVDLLSGRGWVLGPRRTLVILGVALVVSLPYWLPLAQSALAGLPADDLQRRWSTLGFATPPLPLPRDVPGALGTVGCGWMLLRLRTSRLAEALAIALVTGYAFFVGGQLLQRLDIALLPEKSDELITTVLVSGGVLGLVELVTLAASRLRRSAVATALTTAGLLVLAIPLVVGHAQHWLVGPPARAAQQMRYPNGAYPAGGQPDAASHWHPWAVPPTAAGPSTDEVARAWRRLSDRPLDDHTVLLTSRADLLATTPVHPFLAWKSIYSHPHGQFRQRLRLVRRVSACRTSRCAWRLLDANRFDHVDGLVLARTGAGLRLTLATDDFPDAWVFTEVTFAPELFDSTLFDREEVDDVAVIRLRPAARG